MKINGKIGGGITGLLLTGNPIGVIAGAISGHYFWDAKRTKINLSNCNVLETIEGIAVGFIKSNKKLYSHKKKHIYILNNVISQSIQLAKDSKKSVTGNLQYFFKTLGPKDVSILLNNYIHNIEPAQYFFLIDILYSIYTYMGHISESQQLYLNKTAEWLGLKEEDLSHFKNKYSTKSLRHFNSLSVSTFNSYEEIKNRYFYLVKKYHPDKNHNATDLDKIKMINEAWNFIKEIYKQESQMLSRSKKYHLKIESP